PFERSAFTSDPRFASFRVFRGRIFLSRFQNHGRGTDVTITVPRLTSHLSPLTVRRSARPYQPRAPIRRYVSSPSRRYADPPTRFFPCHSCARMAFNSLSARV